MKSPRRRGAARNQELYGNLPLPGSERRAWLLAIGLCLFGLSVLGATLTGLIGASSPSPRTPPPVLFVAQTPVPATAEVSLTQLQPSHRAAVGVSAPRRRADGVRPVRQMRRALLEEGTRVPISNSWMSGFYPIYEVAQHTFGVNWLLLASIHKQESAFSTDPSTYHGLNFAGCCGGPMQFNVTNGPVSTWGLFASSYLYGKRPAGYGHETSKHPSIYDDFDSIMAAAHLLSSDGAGFGLEGAAWNAAYDYYGHDTTGVSYADEVLARAIAWSQHGFCINCGSDQAIREAVHAAYGVPVLAALESSSGKSPYAIVAGVHRRGRLGR